MEPGPCSTSGMLSQVRLCLTDHTYTHTHTPGSVFMPNETTGRVESRRQGEGDEQRDDGRRSGAIKME